jgi:hypothetical protein
VRPETPKVLLLGSTVVVGATSALLPSVSGCGTILFQMVVLGAWGIVARISSGAFADAHHGPVWIVALLLNLGLFLVLALPVYLLTRRKAAGLGAVALVAWLAFYIACLFFLFPATDGP